MVDNKSIFLKQEYNNHQFLYYGYSSAITIPEVFCYNEEANVIITSYLDHNGTFEDLYTNPINWFGKVHFLSLVNATELIAKKMADFHSITPEQSTQFGSSSDQDIRGYLKLRINLVLDHLTNINFSRVLRKDFQQLSYLIEQLDLSENSINPKVIIHGDCTPANFLSLDGDDVGFIDFADTKTAFLTQDIACFQNYLLMLSLNKCWFQRKKAQQLMSCFEKSYWQNSSFKNEPQLLAIFRFRMLLTNTLTLVYECQDNKFKSLYFSGKLHRYVRQLIKSFRQLDN
jgi:Ser/Thr protein kinase RdoA (MazF antagonist)